MIQIAQITVRRDRGLVVDWNPETDAIEMSGYGLSPRVVPKLLTIVESIWWFLCANPTQGTLVLEKMEIVHAGEDAVPARETDIVAFHRERWSHFINNKVAIRARIAFVDKL